jgi:L-amino acid N-acyltransferase YncA
MTPDGRAVSPNGRSVAVSVRAAAANDLEAIRAIYNQGIEDRCATLEASPYDIQAITEWWIGHDERYIVAVAENENGAIVAWGSLNRFSHRCAHSAIADLSVYVVRDQRGHGVGKILLTELLERAHGSFHKIVLHALNENIAGKRLYARLGFREVGVFHEHGELDGNLVDVVVMERLLA